MIDKIEKRFIESSELIRNSTFLAKDIQNAIELIIECLKNEKKIIIFGNGGSAADSQHIAAEFIGRFQKERKSIPAISLTTDSSILTSLSNDYDFESVFSRQCESLVKNGDVVLAISTSGNSKNILKALQTAKEMGANTIALLGNKGGEIKNISDISIIVNSESTARIQEVHRIIYHLICEIVEENFA